VLLMTDETVGRQMRLNCGLKTSVTMWRGGREKMETISEIDRTDDAETTSRSRREQRMVGRSGRRASALMKSTAAADTTHAAIWMQGGTLTERTAEELDRTARSAVPAPRIRVRLGDSVGLWI